MMLRNRSRPVGSKPGLMPDSSSASPPTSLSPTPTSTNQSKHKPSLPFLSPRAFMAFSDSDTSIMSPTSILDTKLLSSPLRNTSFLSDKSLRSPSMKSGTSPICHVTAKPVGLGLVDALDTEEALQDQHLKTESSRKVVLGSKLRIQIPGSFDYSPLKLPVEFGVKNRGAHLPIPSPARRIVPEMAAASSPSARFLVGDMPAAEVEMSEDYTCVISRGPNPRTTHIFDDCIVESCGSGSAFVSRKEETAAGGGGGVLSDQFLRSCHACKKDIGEEDDIFMYGGEKDFCSSECRSQEMLVDEGIKEMFKGERLFDTESF